HVCTQPPHHNDTATPSTPPPTTPTPTASSFTPAPPPPNPTLFPYTTLFRSESDRAAHRDPEGRERQPAHWARGHVDERQYVRRRSEEHTSELQSRCELVCRHRLEQKEEWHRDGHGDAAAATATTTTPTATTA